MTDDKSIVLCSVQVTLNGGEIYANIRHGFNANNNDNNEMQM